MVEFYEFVETLFTVRSIVADGEDLIGGWLVLAFGGVGPAEVRGTRGVGGGVGDVACYCCVAFSISCELSALLAYVS